MKTVEVVISNYYAMLKGSGRIFDPADSKFVTLLNNKIHSKAMIEYNGKKVNLLVGRMLATLNIKEGSTVTITLEGENEENDLLVVLNSLKTVNAITNEEYEKHIKISDEEKNKQIQTLQEMLDYVNEKIQNSIKCTELKRGMTFKIGNDFYECIDLETVEQRRMLSKTLHVNAKNLRKRQTVKLIFGMNELIEPVLLKKRNMEFHYEAADMLYFLDTDTYTIAKVSSSDFEWEKNFLTPALTVCL